MAKYSDSMEARLITAYYQASRLRRELADRPTGVVSVHVGENVFRYLATMGSDRMGAPPHTLAGMTPTFMGFPVCTDANGDEIYVVYEEKIE